MLFFVFLVFLFGSGILRSAYILGGDACLYAENFAATLLIDNFDDPKERKFFHRIMGYYLTSERPPPGAPYSAITEITNVNITGILDILQSPTISSLVNDFSSPTIQKFLNTKLQPETVGALNNLTATIQPLFQSGAYRIKYINFIM